MNFSLRSKIVIQSLPYLPVYTLREMKRCGFEAMETSVTTVETEGSLNDCITLNLRLYTAGSVLWLFRSFKAKSINDVYNGILAIEWEEAFDVKSFFTVDSYSRHQEVRNKMFLNVKCKDAIADRFMKRYAIRPDSGPDKSFVSLYVRWVDDEVRVYIDTTGNTLSRHNYRVNPYKAPMNEALAAAVVMATEWDVLHPFINPMCGSGTLAIEAALMAKKIYPALKRNNFAFMHLKNYIEDFYRKELIKLSAEMQTNIPLKIIASDNNPLAIEAARENALMAEVGDCIDFYCCDFAETKIPDGKGVVLCNPPYGKRLEDDDALNPLYKSIGDFLKQKCKGKTGYIFTGNAEAAKVIGLKPSRRLQFMNAAIECRLFKYELYEGSRRTDTRPGRRDAAAGCNE